MKHVLFFSLVLISYHFTCIGMDLNNDIHNTSIKIEEMIPKDSHQIEIDSLQIKKLSHGEENQFPNITDNKDTFIFCDVDGVLTTLENRLSQSAQFRNQGMIDWIQARIDQKIPVIFTSAYFAEKDTFDLLTKMFKNIEDIKDVKISKPRYYILDSIWVVSTLNNEGNFFTRCLNKLKKSSCWKKCFPIPKSTQSYRGYFCHLLPSIWMIGAKKNNTQMLGYYSEKGVAIRHFLEEYQKTEKQLPLTIMCIDDQVENLTSIKEDIEPYSKKNNIQVDLFHYKKNPEEIIKKGAQKSSNNFSLKPTNQSQIIKNRNRNSNSKNLEDEKTIQLQ